MKPRLCRSADRSYIHGFLREFGLSVQMRLYTMHKREFVMVFIVFFAMLGLALFIGLAGPPITVTAKQKATQLTPSVNQSQLTSGPFVLKSPALSTYAQQLWLISKIIIDIEEDALPYTNPLHISCLRTLTNLSWLAPLVDGFRLQ
ncbi:hypothetical protein SK128_027559 [Halocaridina rubra]|uniref:TMEM181 GOLD domain-containing protein n=1 Tax=Halocaridina rubra TaxID=373956 RepID=A0AAN8WXC3_HALRR